MLAGSAWDQLMLDVTGVEDVQTGDEAVFIGREGGAVIYAEELAENSGSITNELFSRLGARLGGAAVYDVKRKGAGDGLSIPIPLQRRRVILQTAWRITDRLERRRGFGAICGM